MCRSSWDTAQSRQLAIFTCTEFSKHSALPLYDSSQHQQAAGKYPAAGNADRDPRPWPFERQNKCGKQGQDYEEHRHEADEPEKACTILPSVRAMDIILFVFMTRSPLHFVSEPCQRLHYGFIASTYGISLLF